MGIIRKLRREKGWSQQKLADAAAIGKATVQRIEMSETRLTTETAASLAAALGVDAAWLLAEEGLAGAVYNMMATVLNDVTPSPSELGRLPERVRCVFVGYCDARASMLAAEANLLAASTRATEASKATMAVVETRCELLRVAMQSRQPLIEDPSEDSAYESLENERTLAVDHFLTCSRRHGEALDHLVAHSVEVSRMLASFV